MASTPVPRLALATQCQLCTPSHPHTADTMRFSQTPQSGKLRLDAVAVSWNMANGSKLTLQHYRLSGERQLWMDQALIDSSDQRVAEQFDGSSSHSFDLQGYRCVLHIWRLDRPPPGAASASHPGKFAHGGYGYELTVDGHLMTPHGGVAPTKLNTPRERAESAKKDSARAAAAAAVLEAELAARDAGELGTREAGMGAIAPGVTTAPAERRPRRFMSVFGAPEPAPVAKAVRPGAADAGLPASQSARSVSASKPLFVGTPSQSAVAPLAPALCTMDSVGAPLPLARQRAHKVPVGMEQAALPDYADGLHGLVPREWADRIDSEPQVVFTASVTMPPGSQPSGPFRDTLGTASVSAGRADVKLERKRVNAAIVRAGLVLSKVLSEDGRTSFTCISAGEGRLMLEAHRIEMEKRLRTEYMTAPIQTTNWADKLHTYIISTLSSSFSRRPGARDGQRVQRAAPVQRDARPPPASEVQPLQPAPRPPSLATPCAGVYGSNFTPRNANQQQQHRDQHQRRDAGPVQATDILASPPPTPPEGPEGATPPACADASVPVGGLGPFSSQDGDGQPAGADAPTQEPKLHLDALPRRPPPPRNWKSTAYLRSRACSSESTHITSSATSDTPTEIPPRSHRDPTEILDASNPKIRCTALRGRYAALRQRHATECHYNWSSLQRRFA